MDPVYLPLDWNASNAGNVLSVIQALESGIADQGQLVYAIGVVKRHVQDVLRQQGFWGTLSTPVSFTPITLPVFEQLAALLFKWANQNRTGLILQPLKDVGTLQGQVDNGGCSGGGFAGRTPELKKQLGDKAREADGLLNALEDIVKSRPPAEIAVPNKYLFGWKPILAALDQPDNQETRSTVSRLNELHQGPIVIAGQGSKPRTEKRALLEWWNSLYARWLTDNRQANKAATLESSHPYHAEGVVFPDIAGQERKRKKSSR